MRLGMALLAIGGLLTFVPTEVVAQKKQRDVITHEEIEKSGQKDQDLLSAIRGMRPHFLEGPRGIRSLGGGAMMPLVLYVDGRKQPGLDVLQTIMALDVKEVRYLDPNRSQNEYGITANGGAIVVKLTSAKGKEK